MRWTVMRCAARDERRDSLQPEHCRDVAVTAVAVSVAALTGAQDGTVAQRLARAWTPASAGGAWFESVTRALDVALSVLVDHELTASTLAARTAGVGADPWMVLLTGLAAMSGRAQAGRAVPPRPPCGRGSPRARCPMPRFRGSGTRCTSVPIPVRPAPGACRRRVPRNGRRGRRVRRAGGT
ncbi:citrate/2-methylcitrate synthase [Streptomyces thermocarboxydus]